MLNERNCLDTPKVIIARGRDFDDYEYMKDTLNELLPKLFKTVEFCIISGMADGADALAVHDAGEAPISQILCPANWKRNGKKAGLRRNETMFCIAMYLVAFWDGMSHGAKHIIEIAHEKGVPVWVFEYKSGIDEGSVDK